MNKMKLTITGCLGRMGQQLVKSSKNSKNFKLVSLTENRIINKKISGLRPQLNSVSAFKNANVIIDFTIPKCTLEVLKIASKLKLSIEEAALSILDVVTENMAQEIKNLTIHQGVNPNKSVLISGGGASGMNVVNLAKRLGCEIILIPDLGPVLSAAGSMVANITNEFSLTFTTNTKKFDYHGANLVLEKDNNLEKDPIKKKNKEKIKK